MSEEPAAVTETEENRKDNVQVCVRCRPMSESEILGNYKNIITVDHIGGTVTVNSLSPSEPPKVSKCHLYTIERNVIVFLESEMYGATRSSLPGFHLRSCVRPRLEAGRCLQ